MSCKQSGQEKTFEIDLNTAVRLRVYSTIPFGFNMFWALLRNHTILCLAKYDSSISEKRIWSILLILSDLKNGVSILVEDLFCISTT